MRWLSFLTTGWIIWNVSCILLYLSAFCFPLNISDSYLPKSKKEKACCQSDWFMWAKLAQRRCFLSFCPIEHLADDISRVNKHILKYYKVNFAVYTVVCWQFIESLYNDVLIRPHDIQIIFCLLKLLKKWFKALF